MVGVIADYKTDDALRGQGSVSYRTEYHYEDTSVELEETYDYRLADVSYDGMVTYYDMLLTGVTIGQLPTVFKLYPNYPNPFNNTTVIKYSLPKTTDVTIKFYNILGQPVHTHKFDNMAPGYYSYLWNSKNDLGQMVSSGIYFYQLEADDPSSGSGQVFTNVKKCILMK